jgi:DNA-binding response OmpR family regulator
MNILLIDDSKFVRSAIGKALAEKGYGISAVSDGEAGIRAAAQQPPDLILLDVMLPGVPGTNILTRLKSDPALAGIPIVVLTAVGGVNETRLLDEGADECLHKGSLDLDNGCQPLVEIIERVHSRYRRKSARILLTADASVV